MANLAPHQGLNTDLVAVRNKGKLMVVHCAALLSHLLESDLFGQWKSAFTGAHERRIRWFE